MKIIPAVLSSTLDDYSKAYGLFEQMPGNSKIHIDIMDGEFVQTTSPDFEAILKIPTDLPRQVHLMVMEPLAYLELCAKYSIDEVIVHLGTNYGNLNNFNDYPFPVFLGINPEDKYLAFADMRFKVAGFLIMTVYPGLQGQAFLEAELEKCGYLRNAGFDGKIIVDGSVNSETITKVMNYAVDEVVVGSAIIKQPDPISSYNQLIATISC